MRSLRLLLALLAGAVIASSAAQAQPTLYWTDQSNNRIQRLNLDGSVVENIVEGPLAQPGNMAFDVVDRHLYWSNTGRNQIVRMNEDGSDKRVIQAGHLVAIDADARLMYVLLDTTLQRTNLEGDDTEVLLPLPGLSNRGWTLPAAVVDVRVKKVYWYFRQSTGDGKHISGVRRANLDGSEQEFLFDNQGHGIAFVGLAIDTVGNRLYMQDGWGTHNFSSIDLDGSGYKRWDHHTMVQDIAVHPTKKKLYWVAGREGSNHAPQLYRSNLDGSDVEALVSLERNPSGIAIDPLRGRLYWGTASGIWRSELTDRYVEGIRPIITTNLRNLGSLELDITAGHLYWTNGKVIGRHDLDGRNETTIVEGQGEIIEDLTIDPQRGYLYWSQTWNSGGAAASIIRSGLDGSGIVSPVILPGSNGGPIALDVYANRLYWTSRVGIHVADADGSNQSEIRHYPAQSAWPPIDDLALDTANGRIYWTQWNVSYAGWTSSDGSITARLSGDTKDWTGAIAVDSIGGHLYWAEEVHQPLAGTPSGSIWRRSLREQADPELIASGLGFVSSLALDPEAAAMAVETVDLPVSNILAPNFPNPFNLTTTIQYTLQSTEQVSITVSDMLGRIVAILDDGLKPAGSHLATWTADEDTPSGVYFYTMETGGVTVTRSILLLK